MNHLRSRALATFLVLLFTCATVPALAADAEGPAAPFALLAQLTDWFATLVPSGPTPGVLAKENSGLDPNGTPTTTEEGYGSDPDGAPGPDEPTGGG